MSELRDLRYLQALRYLRTLTKDERQEVLEEVTMLRVHEDYEDVSPEQQRLWMAVISNCSHVLGDDGLCDCARTHFESLETVRDAVDQHWNDAFNEAQDKLCTLCQSVLD